MFTGKRGGRGRGREGGGKGKGGDARKDAGCENRDALGLEKKGGGCLFLGPHSIRWRGPRSTPPLSIPSFPTFLLGTCSRHRGSVCVQNTNKRETAGCQSADVLLPSPVCSPETMEDDRTGQPGQRAHHEDRLLKGGTLKARGHEDDRGVQSAQSTTQTLYSSHKYRNMSISSTFP